ncbi:MAG: hypothetical protein SPI25_03615 [Dialister sp.]|nr:hypothetical protein [Dialister sp.]
MAFDMGKKNLKRSFPPSSIGAVSDGSGVHLLAMRLSFLSLEFHNQRWLMIERQKIEFCQLAIHKDCRPVFRSSLGMALRA